MKSLSHPDDQQQLWLRLSRLSPEDKRLWGVMSIMQMVCHLHDSYQVPLGERLAGPAPGLAPRRLFKSLALYAPMTWPKGVPTRPEVEQGKGGSPPGDFRDDLARLLSTYRRFCAGLPTPCVGHPNFGPMTKEDWMRWGYLHADHHLRQFGH